MDGLLAALGEETQAAEALAALLGRMVAEVERAADALALDGVPILRLPSGLALAPGTPAPRLVPVRGTLGAALRYAGTVTSTQDAVRAWANDAHTPAPHGAVQTAERQTAGRGRRGRAWTTTGGTLVFSVLLRPKALDLSPARLPLLPLAAGVALRAGAGVGGLKWPNDLLAPDGRKFAGVLLEAEYRGDTVRRAVLGIGFNVSAAPPGAAHLAEFRPELTRAALLADVLAELEHWLTAPAPELLAAWRAASVTLGRPVRVQTGGALVEGVARDLTADGALVVDTGGGPVTIGAGDVELVARKNSD